MSWIDLNWLKKMSIINANAMTLESGSGYVQNSAAISACNSSDDLLRTPLTILTDT